MFIVKKKISGKEYYYLQKSVRKGDKIISKSVAYLGKDKKQAEKKAEEIKNKITKGEEIEKVGEEKQPIEEKLEKKDINIEELTNFCKEKGFVFRSSDIYGGFSGFWDFGPLGIELFNNIKQNWWDWFVKSREDIAGMEGSIISHPKTWEASGHIKSFNDVFVKCKDCGKTGKLDEQEVGKVKCDCGGEYESQGKFNLMFQTKVGAVNADEAYLRGETAQGMFMNFKLIQQTSRMQLPFGIAQIGRCFRNEIAPRDFLFRDREFHIGEFEFFINPEEKSCELLDDFHKDVKVKLLDKEAQKANKKELRKTTIGEMVKEKRLGEWHGYWLAEQVLWFENLGLSEIKIREHTKEELSHYSSATFDIDYEYSFGSKEVAGNANRGQYDLNQHAKFSKQSMEIFDEKYKKKIVPRVIEPTFGMERVFLAVLTKAYYYSKKRDYIVLKIPGKLAPIKAAVFPVVRNNEEIFSISREIYNDLRSQWNVVFDSGGAIGRRYARQDTIGTPLAITVDEQAVKDNTITLRERDTTRQIRVKITDLKEVISRYLGGGEFEKLGKVVETRKK